MRRQAASLWSLASHSSRHRIRTIDAIGRRHVRIYATPSSTAPAGDEVDLSSTAGESSPDAKFEVLGAPFSLLSVQLSPSQTLYTRRGTLVAVSGKPENAVSTLSLLSPLTRLPLGIPFLYQAVSSSTPLTALIANRTPNTSITTIHLDGRLDWMIAQRNALVAWTGHNLRVKPRMNSRLSLQHWGNTFVSGRGLVALAGKGQIYQVAVREGEEYVVHPSHVLAYTQSASPPSPYRFRSSTLKLAVPSLSGLLPDTRFFNEMKKSQLWNVLASALFKVRQWTRRNVWGDRLFLTFRGPTTVLIQSRAGRLRDSLSKEEVDEIADSPAGHVQNVLRVKSQGASSSSSSSAGGHAAGANEKEVVGDRKESDARKVDKVVDSKKDAPKIIEGEGVDSGPGNFDPEPAEIRERKPAAVSWATVSRGGKVDWKEGDKKP